MFKGWVLIPISEPNGQRLPSGQVCVGEGPTKIPHSIPHQSNKLIKSLLKYFYYIGNYSTTFRSAKSAIPIIYLYRRVSISTYILYYIYYSNNNIYGLQAIEKSNRKNRKYHSVPLILNYDCVRKTNLNIFFFFRTSWVQSHLLCILITIFSKQHNYNFMIVRTCCLCSYFWSMRLFHYCFYFFFFF